MPDNRLLNHAQANEAISTLYEFITRLNEPVELIFLFGIAFDTAHADIDRNRFASAISYFLKKEKKDLEVKQKKLFVCIDPNLDYDNITELFKKLKKELLQSESSVSFVHGEPIQIGGLQEENIRLLMYSLDNTKKISPTFFKISPIVGEGDNEDQELEYYIYFMRYPVPMKRSTRKNITEFATENLLNIQDSIKTLQTYLQMDDCKYEPDSFYHSLETLALHPNVTSLYVASAMNSHDLGLLQRGNSYFMSKAYDGYYVSNRYFETTCEVLTLMNSVQEQGKPVFFLTLNRVFRTFNHENIPRDAPVPYLVPFTNKTKFFVDEPPMLAPFSIETGKFLGGNRKKTRSHKKKSRKTRKH